MESKQTINEIDSLINFSEQVGTRAPESNPIRRAKDILFRSDYVLPLIADEIGGLKEAFLPYFLVIGLVPMAVGCILSAFLWGFIGSLSGPVNPFADIAGTVFRTVLHAVSGMVGILLLGKIAEYAAPSFGLRKSWVLSTRALVYGSTPSSLAAAVSWIPFVGTLLSSAAFFWSAVLTVKAFKVLLRIPTTPPENTEAVTPQPRDLKLAIPRLVIIGILAFGMTTAGHAKEIQGPKKRIAVTQFHDKSNQSSHYWANVGDGMADMLTTALQKTGHYVMVERNQLGEVKEEQALARDGAVQNTTGAKSSQLIGAGYLVTGSVTEFGIKNAKYGAGNLGSLLPIGGRASLVTQTARVALDLRFFDTTTGQLIATEQAVGSKTSRRIDSELEKLPSIEFGKEGFDDTVIGQATREAIEKAVASVEKHMEKTPWYGRIVKTDGSSLFINTGEDDGRHPGDTFTVVRVSQSMTDPDTGEPLGAERTTLGKIRIAQVVGKRLAKAEPIGSLDIQAGDVIE